MRVMLETLHLLSTLESFSAGMERTRTMDLKSPNGSGDIGFPAQTGPLEVLGLVQMVQSHERQLSLSSTVVGASFGVMTIGQVGG